MFKKGKDTSCTVKQVSGNVIVSLRLGRAGELHRAEGGKRNGGVVLVSHGVHRSRAWTLSVLGRSASSRALHAGTLLPRLVERRTPEAVPVLSQTTALHESKEEPTAVREVPASSRGLLPDVSKFHRK